MLVVGGSLIQQVATMLLLAFTKKIKRKTARENSSEISVFLLKGFPLWCDIFWGALIEQLRIFLKKLNANTGKYIRNPHLSNKGLGLLLVEALLQHDHISNGGCRVTVSFSSQLFSRNLWPLDVEKLAAEKPAARWQLGCGCVAPGSQRTSRGSQG